MGGCRYRPADAWRIYTYLGRDIRDFLATAPPPLAIVDGPKGEGPTYVFEYLRVDSVPVPDLNPPTYESKRYAPGIPAARPGQPSLQPNRLQLPVPGNGSSKPGCPAVLLAQGRHRPGRDYPKLHL